VWHTLQELKECSPRRYWRGRTYGWSRRHALHHGD